MTLGSSYLEGISRSQDFVEFLLTYFHPISENEFKRKEKS